MKKLLALVLAAALALSLVACGGGSGAGDNNTPSEDINPNDVAIGTWKGEYTVEKGSPFIPAGTRMIMILEIYQGGTGRLERYLYDKYEDGEPNTSNPGTWEVSDSALNFTENSIGNSTLGFAFDVEQETLTSFSIDNLVLTKDS